MKIVIGVGLTFREFLARLSGVKGTDLKEILITIELYRSYYAIK